MTLSQRFYFRTELFSYFLLGLTFWCLAARPTWSWLTSLNRFTAGRPYWLLPIIMLLWVNLDAWFFLGVATVVVWAAFALVMPTAESRSEGRVLFVVAAFCVAASFCSPFYFKGWMELQTQLFPPTGTELMSRWAERKLQQPSAAQQMRGNVRPNRISDQERFFQTPWSADYLDPIRYDAINGPGGLATQDPLLPLCYPKGVSLSEWAYYPLVVLALGSILASGARRHFGRIALLILFLGLSALQSRLVGFFAVAAAALAILNFQSGGPRIPSLSRGRIMLSQFGRLGLGVVLQVISLLMLVPSPDTNPAPFGHVHARGHFGLAFRIDPSMRGVEEQLVRWRQAGQLDGRTFHLDWVDQAAYDAWFNPGGRHFFDRRHEVHSAETVKAFFAIQDSLTRVTPERATIEQLTPEKLLEKRRIWQELFRRHDISHIVVRRRGELLRALLGDFDEQNQPIWRPLQYHDGTYFVLAWTGSPHAEKLKALQFNPGESAFRLERRVTDVAPDRLDAGSLTSFLRGDAPRRPAGLDEANWYMLLQEVDPVSFLARNLTSMEILGGLVTRLGGHLSVPTFHPPVPLVLTPSSSNLYLALQSARRAVTQLPADANVAQRADAWQGYFLAIENLSRYEASFAPVAATFREPLWLFALRQATFANEAAGRPDAPLQHLQLARVYRARRAHDAAHEHYQTPASSLSAMPPRSRTRNGPLTRFRLLSNSRSASSRPFWRRNGSGSSPIGRPRWPERPLRAIHLKTRSLGPALLYSSVCPARRSMK